MKKLVAFTLLLIVAISLFSVAYDWIYLENPFFHKAMTDTYDPYRFKGIEKIEATIDNRSVSYELLAADSIRLYPYNCPHKYTTIGEIDISLNQSAEFKTFMEGYTGEYERWVFEPIDYKLFWDKIIKEVKEQNANGIMNYKMTYYIAYKDKKVEQAFEFSIIRFEGYLISVED